MSAERLRQAAARLDALTESATPGPWRVCGPTLTNEGPDRGADVVWDDAEETDLTYTGTGVATGDLSYGAASEADASYIAAMHPLVGKALAAWLRDVAEAVLNTEDQDVVGILEVDNALAVADAILGGAA